MDVVSDEDIYMDIVRDDPPLSPPFAVMPFGESSMILDREGRVVVNECRMTTFIDELAKVLNENSERLVKAWNSDLKRIKRSSRSRRRR